MGNCGVFNLLEDFLPRDEDCFVIRENIWNEEKINYTLFKWERQKINKVCVFTFDEIKSYQATQKYLLNHKYNKCHSYKFYLFEQQKLSLIDWNKGIYHAA